MICRSSFIATPSGRLPQKQFTKKDPGSRLYRASWLFLTGNVASISCAFSASSFLLQILWNSFRHHSRLMLLSLSSVTKLSLLLGFCAACMLSYRYLQMEWWAAVTVVAIPSQPAQLMCHDRVFHPPDLQCSHLGPLALFCTADTLLIASCLSWSENWLLVYILPPPSPIVSFASMGFLCHSNTALLHPVSAWSPIPMYCREAGGCLPFLFLLDTILFETLLIHPCTMLKSCYHTRVVAYIDLSSLFAYLFASSWHTITDLSKQTNQQITTLLSRFLQRLLLCSVHTY